MSPQSAPAASALKIRSVQLDLARQMETVDFIKNFADFAAENGFNALTLYLEARIRTSSFPHPSEEESYSPAQIREIVAHAASRGLDVIPVVSTLGHAELFLRHGALAGLAETRGSFEGRFGKGHDHVFCPSLPETYTFLRSYLTEVTELFPSSFFHAGCDEAWDMGRCDLCRGRLENGESQAGIFAEHLRQTHDIVTGQLGKRMILWDDMFEYYPEALDSLPRDVVLAHWQYQDRVGPSRGHFFHRIAENTPKKYAALGFDFLVCPADYTLENAESFTAYAMPERPLGGLLTTWGKANSFLLRSRPLIAAVGRMWEAGTVRADMEGVTSALFGTRDSGFTRAIQAFCRSGLFRDERMRSADFLTRRENTHDHASESLTDLLLEILPGYREEALPAARPILEDILLSLAQKQTHYRLEAVLPELLEGGSPVAEAGLQEILSRIAATRDAHLALWQATRPGISPSSVEASYNAFIGDLRHFPELAATHGVLSAHFCLPDQYSAQTTRILVRYAGSETAELAAQGVFKEDHHFDAFYSRLFPIAKDRIPEALRIETFGFGGQGFTWFEIRNDLGRFIPESIRLLQGLLDHPDNLLVPDWRWAFAGEPDTRHNYFDSEGAKTIHAFEVILRKA